MLFENDLNILWDNNGTFVDISKELVDYGRDTKVLDLVALEDYVYVGLYKPFSQVYAELKVVNAVVQTFTAQYWNGTTWTSLDNFYDESLGWTRSSFMSWSKSTSWAKTTVNSIELFWIRLRPSANITSTTEVQGLNIVYSNDNSLVNEFSQVLSYLGTLTSFITYHQSVRDDIVQAVRNSGKSKITATGLIHKNITKWDFLDIDEIKRGATYFCLAKIFFELSDKADDKWYQRYKDYMVKGNKSMELYFLSLDVNDSGKNESGKMAISQPISLVRT